MASSRNPGSEIHLGDLILALSDLPWQSEEQARKIAAALGFSQQNPQQHKIKTNRATPFTGARNRIWARQSLPSLSKTISTPPPPAPRIDLPDGVLPGTLS
ncbi:MAG: hypothetical protein P8101_12385, partial [Candidatus Thiodiazotropha sp.]